jgi:hypothetical protein
MRLIAVSALLLLVACAAEAKPPEPPTVAVPPPPPAETVETAATAPAPTAEPPPTATATAVIEAPPPPPNPAVCRGADLDLDVLAAGKDCDVRRAASPPPPPKAVGIELVPARARIAPGDKVDLTLAIVNKTDAELELDLSMSCGKAHQFQVEALDARGKRADRIERCGYGVGCGRRTLHLVLAPRGRVHTALAFEAKVDEEDEQCHMKPPQPIRPGTYKLRASTPLRDEDKVHPAEMHPRYGEAKITVAR